MRNSESGIENASSADTIGGSGLTAGGPGGSMTTSPLGHRLMFLLLATLAFAVFAPTVLLPILNEHCQLLAEERRLTDSIDKLGQEVARLEELVYAFENDVIINERLAVLDLHYKRPDEVVVPVIDYDRLASGGGAPADSTGATAVAAVPGGRLALPDDWPAWTHRAEAWAAQRGLIAIFLDDGLRPVFLLLSCGLLIAAFVIFAPRVRFGPTRQARVAST